ncbi:unnamed protein product [Notodromas monacha]|uniref:Uncharacterized protein n=1 Tax=Notodromas monacha TaxID=399045 RepID=A0A7R9BNQ3_9CRUS|nr:unnamed protein product [Notodromas monacha]CAG0918885.1 unnamed protein product [Notodromas monacha]
MRNAGSVTHFAKLSACFALILLVLALVGFELAAAAPRADTGDSTSLLSATNLQQSAGQQRCNPCCWRKTGPSCQLMRIAWDLLRAAVALTPVFVLLITVLRISGISAGPVRIINNTVTRAAGEQLGHRVIFPVRNTAGEEPVFESVSASHFAPLSMLEEFSTSFGT